jgi:hypothetical protein
MVRIGWTTSIAALVFLASAAADGSGDEPRTPADEYRALLETYQKLSGGGAMTDDERLRFVGRVYKHRYELALKFLELAEKHPADAIAIDALMRAAWQVNNTPWPAALVGKDPASARALAILERDHIRSEKLGEVCERVSFGFNKEYDAFLRAVLAKSPQPSVRAQACLGLAHYLGNRLQRLDLIEEQPDLAGEFEDLFGKEYLAELRRQDRAGAGKELEALLERAAAEYGKVEIPGGEGTVGRKAEAELFEVRHLAAGKTAPDIEGQDQDGVRFKLSDYRGKVVLLDFWHQQ